MVVIDKSTADDVRTILRNIASDYGYSETRARKVLQDIGIKPEVMSGVDIAAELKMGSGADARMDTSGRGQGVSSQYNGSSPNGRESSYGLDEKGGERGRTLRRSTELSFVERDSEGKPVRKQYPATPGVVSEARRQKAIAELNKKLREIRLGHRENLPDREALGLRWDPSTKTPPFCGWLGLQAGVVYSLDTNDHKIVYLVDHSSDSELYENLREGGDGFGIRKTFEVDKITADDIRTILRNIASDYGYSAARLRNRLQALRIRPEVMSGVDIAAELEKGSGADARMDVTGRGQGISSGYNGSRPDGGESSSRLDEKGGERGRTLRGGTELSLVERDSEGKPIRKRYPATPGAVSEARRQKAFAELNKKLREIRLGQRENLPDREALGLRWDPSTKTPPFCGWLGLQAGVVYSLDTNDHKIVCLVDHSSDRELYENLREGGDGFGIRKTFEVNSIIKDDIREITRNIAPFYDYSAARISGVLQAAGIGQANLFSTDIAAELKRIIDSNDAVYGEDRANWPKGRSYGRYDNNNGERGSGTEGGIRQNTELSLVERDAEGKPVRRQYPATPGAVSEARRQKAFAELNKKQQGGAPRTLGRNMPSRDELGLRRDPSTKTPPFCG